MLSNFSGVWNFVPRSLVNCQGFCKVDNVTDRQRPEPIALMVETYYDIGLFHTNYTNYFYITHKHITIPVSLTMVSAASPKEETNVFPNGHPLPFDLCYPGSIGGVMLCRRLPYRLGAAMPLPAIFAGVMLHHHRSIQPVT
jgi:hypothetical protein